MRAFKFCIRLFFFVLIIICLIQCSVVGDSKLTVNYIDPFIGTDGLGHTTPSATTPFGMIQLGPSMDIQPWNWKRCSGYHYEDSCIMGFAHNHISGAGLCGLGDILVMPMTGELKLVPGTLENPNSGYMSRFSHDQEKASAGYYAVHLSDYNIDAELTASPRVGFHRYTIEDSDSVHFVFDPIHGIGEYDYSGEVEFLSSTELRGYKYSNGSGGPRKVYFYAKFSKPFDKYGVSTDGLCYPDKNFINSNTVKGYVTFDTHKGEVIELSVALSHVSYEGALANYNAEAINKSFDEIHAEARKMWQEKCDKFVIEGTEEEKKIFYTAVYHSFFSPNLISDVTGDYFVDGKKLHSKLIQYSNISTWDTYRATHPLYTLIEQKKTSEFVNSLASRYFEAGTGLPLWECVGYDNCCMVGRSPVAIMAEAILKEVPGINTENAYESMRYSLMATDKASPNYGKDNGMKSYLQNNFVTGDVGCSVSKTVEYNYYDYAMSKLAEKMNKSQDVAYFYQRSLGYRNLWNSEKKYLWPKYETGEWKTVDMSNWEDLIANYISGNIWGYSAYTPHDMDYMIGQMGGKDRYVEWLDRIFNDTTVIKGEQHVDISGFIGKYGHGDEPSHQIPYLYTLAGCPEKTQMIVQKIRKELYDATPNGLVNNDDLGQMSSWYIFSVLGFYPVNPVSCEYVLGSPLYKTAQLHFENGKSLIIRTENWEPGRYLVDKIFFNGNEITNGKISHFDLIKGGVLLFRMK